VQPQACQLRQLLYLIQYLIKAIIHGTIAVLWKIPADVKVLTLGHTSEHTQC
jgi:hypothetical protein